MRFLFPLLFLGCVPKKDFLALQQELASTQERHAASMAECEANLAALRDANREQERALRALRADIEQREEALRALREKNAAMLKDRGALAAQVSEMRAALQELEARKAAADARLRAFKDLLDRFRSLIDAGTLEVKIKDGRMLVVMATDVLFASGSATLSAEGKEALAEVTRILASIPDREFQVEGHTDDDPIHTAQFPNNWFLASHRALNVVQHMLDNGMPPERISGASFGEYRPVAPNDTPENKALNRRIEIVVVPDLSQMPGYEELQALQ